MKLSVILPGRNDNYCGDYLQRLKCCVESLKIALGGSDWEAVIVDYNQIKEAAPLSHYFPDSPRIKNVVVTNEMHREFVRKHLDNGSRLFYDNFELADNEIYKFNFFITCAFNEGLKNSRGEYILMTGSDNLFPVGFREAINYLEVNTVYRAWKRSITQKDASKQFDKIVNGKRYKTSREMKKLDKKRANIWAAAGDFILMDKKSWIEIGGFMPTINPNPLCVDNQCIFFALASRKKISALDYYIVNIEFETERRNFHKKMNCKMHKNNICYNHLEEIRSSEWRKFKGWAKQQRLKPNNIYHLDVDYKERLEEIKRLIKAILDDHMVVY